MGATKRKAAESGKSKSAGRRRRRATTKAPPAPSVTLEGRATEDLMHELTEASDSLVVNLMKLVDHLTEDASAAVEVPAEFHEQAKFLCDLEALGKKMKERLKGLYYDLRDRGATFIHGQFAPQFKEGERRSPSWKEEAIVQRKEVAALKGETDFDAKVYEAQVLAKTPASTTKSLSFANLG